MPTSASRGEDGAHRAIAASYQEADRQRDDESGSKSQKPVAVFGIARGTHFWGALPDYSFVSLGVFRAEPRLRHLITA